MNGRLKELVGYFYKHIEDLKIDAEALPGGLEIVRMGSPTYMSRKTGNTQPLTNLESTIRLAQKGSS